MRNKLQLLACILVAGALGHCRGVTAANGYPPLEASLVEGTIVPAVLKALADSTLPGGPARPLLAGMVRHAFHDCAGGQGCDGCVSMNTTQVPTNKGLPATHDKIEELYGSLALRTVMSRADFYALCGTIALSAAVRGGSAVPQLLDPHYFQWGRPDCATSPLAPMEMPFDFPAPAWGYAGVMGYFARRFGFNNAETVAIMGAHNLGHAHLMNTGFQGAWSLESDRLGSGYYANLANASLAWAQTQNPPMEPGDHVRYQWSSAPVDNGKPLMMFNADMALMKDVWKPNPSTGQAECTYYACADALSKDQVVRYARQEQPFLDDFAAVWWKMTSVCGRRLQDDWPIPCNLSPMVGGGVLAFPPPAPVPQPPCRGKKCPAPAPSPEPAYAPQPCKGKKCPGPGPAPGPVPSKPCRGKDCGPAPGAAPAPDPQPCKGKNCGPSPAYAPQPCKGKDCKPNSTPAPAPKPCKGKDCGPAPAPAPVPSKPCRGKDCGPTPEPCKGKDCKPNSAPAPTPKPCKGKDCDPAPAPTPARAPKKGPSPVKAPAPAPCKGRNCEEQGGQGGGGAKPRPGRNPAGRGPAPGSAPGPRPCKGKDCTDNNKDGDNDKNGGGKDNGKLPSGGGKAPKLAPEPAPRRRSETQGGGGGKGDSPRVAGLTIINNGVIKEDASAGAKGGGGGGSSSGDAAQKGADGGVGDGNEEQQVDPAV